jgi:hypothetical protein
MIVNAYGSGASMNSILVAALAFVVSISAYADNGYENIGFLQGKTLKLKQAYVLDKFIPHSDGHGGFYTSSLDCVTGDGQVVADSDTNEQCFDKLSCHLLFVSDKPAEIAAGSTWALSLAVRAWGGNTEDGYFSNAEIETLQRNATVKPVGPYLDSIGCDRTNAVKISDDELKRMLSYIVEIQN